MIYLLKQDHYVEGKIYSVKHFWAGDGEPTEYFVSSEKKPSQKDVVSVLGINYDPRGDEIVIKLLDVEDLALGLRMKGVRT
jgi:hypothetical protein